MSVIVAYFVLIKNFVIKPILDQDMSYAACKFRSVLTCFGFSLQLEDHYYWQGEYDI